MKILNKCKMPQGTVFLIGSPSHLEKEGTASYLRQYVDTAAKLRNKFTAIQVGHLPAILLNSTSSPELIRSRAEVMAWMQKAMADTVMESLAVIRELGLNRLQASYYTRFELTIRAFSKETKLWVSGGCDNLPGAVDSLDKEKEKRFINSILQELNAKMAMELDTRPKNCFTFFTQSLSYFCDKTKKVKQNLTILENLVYVKRNFLC